MRPLALLLLLFAAFPLSADPLAEVRGALGRLTARDAVRGTYEIERNVHSEGRFDNDKSNGKVAVEVEGDANGFRIVLGRPLLDHVAREQQARAKTSRPAPTVEALGEISPVHAGEAIDFAPPLLRLLDGAKLLSDAGGTWMGKPARVLVLRAADRLDGEDKDRMKIIENRVTLWLGGDLVPLAAEHLVSSRFSFLFLRAEWKEKRSWHFARSGDRLVRARFEERVTASGMGQKVDQTLIATLRLH